MADCLITRLKGVVNNDTLPKLGIIRVISEPASFSSSKNLRIFSTEVASAVAKKGEFYSQNGSSIGKELSIVANDNTYIYFSPQETIAEFDKKYNYRTFAMEDSGLYVLDSNPFKYINALQDLRLTAKTIALNDFSELKNLTRLDISYVGNKDDYEINDIAAIESLTNLERLGFSDYGECVFVGGDILAFRNMIKLNRLQIVRTKITGNLNQLLDALFANGKKSGNLIFLGNGLVTLNNTIIENAEAVTINFNSEGWFVA